MNIDVLVASNLWWKERKEKGAHHWITKNLPFLFDTLDALHPETRKLPLRSKAGLIDREVTTAYTFTYNMVLSAQDYGTLRSIVSLSGDVYNLLTPLVNVNPESLLELSAPIKELYKLSISFRGVRNFFTHLNEVLTNMDKHGISGPVTTDCHLSYTKSAKSCVHLVWDNNTIYFTWHNEEQKIKIDRPAFQPVFQTALEIYKVITSHNNTSTTKDYTAVEKMYQD